MPGEGKRKQGLNARPSVHRHCMRRRKDFKNLRRRLETRKERKWEGEEETDERRKRKDSLSLAFRRYSIPIE